MKHVKSSKTFALFALSLSLLPTISQAGISARQIKAVSDKSWQAEQITAKIHVVQYLSSILSASPLAVVQTKQINPLTIKDLSELGTSPEEKSVLNMWAQLINENKLKSSIVKLIAELKASPTPIAKTLNALPASQQEYAINSLTSSIEGVVKMRGLTQDSNKNTYLEWGTLSEKMLKMVNQSKVGDTLALAQSSWVKTASAEILVNGPASFAKRDLFMSQAQSSINILTWSIYDDVTGTEAADLLISKKQANPDLKIRVIVDGQVAATSGHGDQVKRLEDAGIEVIRWFSADLTYVGQHRKMLIVDNEHMIAGGLNFGDVYSHKNPDLSVKRWRDTDVYVKGAGAEEGNRLFAKLWNEQLAVHKELKYEKMTVAAGSTQTPSESSVEIAVINNNPELSQKGSTIMLTILKAIHEAKTQIDIENAYIILFPALKQEIQAAIARGVQVRVFTNSSESVDEPVVSIPILRSVSEFVKMGAKVYVKKGATLHSKIMAIDSSLSMIMSYNLHPRSERVEGEMAIAVRGTEFTANLHKVFDEDVVSDKADEIKVPSDLKMPNSPVSVPTLRLFFDML